MEENTKKHQVSDVMGKFYYFKVMAVPKLSQQKERKLSNSLYEASVTVNPKPNKDCTCMHTHTHTTGN